MKSPRRRNPAVTRRAGVLSLVARAVRPGLRKRQPPGTGSALPKWLLRSLEVGTLGYSYKGIPTAKDPFDFALYPVLLWRIKPRTIIEIGSYRGGSAVWLSDTMRTFGMPCRIHSVDLNKVTDVTATDVTFYQGDSLRLETLFDDAFMSKVERPLMVIEDASHKAADCLAVLRFFDRWLRPGEYIVIEDGIISDMGDAHLYAGGPVAAIHQFLDERGDLYEIDRTYCDWFGRNITWNTDGYLRRVR
jgi:cephalosporin hydroxylase